MSYIRIFSQKVQCQLPKVLCPSTLKFTEKNFRCQFKNMQGLCVIFSLNPRKSQGQASLKPSAVYEPYFLFTVAWPLMWGRWNRPRCKVLPLVECVLDNVLSFRHDSIQSLPPRTLVVLIPTPVLVAHGWKIKTCTKGWFLENLKNVEGELCVA